MKKPTKKAERLKGFGVRADEEKMAKAKEQGIDIGNLFRRALDIELLKTTGKCPTCGRGK